jgi:hypothetical protein
VFLGIMFGAMPGLTSTLGVALLTALTYGMDTSLAMVCLLAIYVGGTYGGSYASILINIPGHRRRRRHRAGRLSPGLQGGRRARHRADHHRFGHRHHHQHAVRGEHFAHHLPFCAAVYLFRIFSAGVFRYS